MSRRTVDRHAARSWLCLQDDRDWPVVRDFDDHARAEDTRLRQDADCAELFNEPLVESIGDFWSSCVREAWAVALARVFGTSDVNRRMESR